MSNDEIEKYINKLETEAEALEKNLLQIVWSMRGGISITEAYQLSPSQQEHALELFKDNLEVAKSTHLPFF